ncbi:MAG: sigma-70 family RNA polymerase sigma factor [bacterium]
MENQLDSIAELAKTNEQAFNEVFDLCYPLMYRYCFSKVMDQHTAEEIVADTFEVIVKKLQQFDPVKASFKTWIFSILNHKLADYLRKKYRLKQKETNLMEELAVNLVANSDVDHEILLQQILANLEKLPTTEAEVIRLKYYGALTNPEIASLLSLTNDSVSVLLSRGLKKMAKILN